MNNLRKKFVSCTRTLAPTLALAMLSASIAGCVQPSPDEGDVGTTQDAVTIPGANVLGFETLGAWAVSSGTTALVPNLRTEGATALGVTAPLNYTTLTSVALSSGLAPLASLTQVGATVKLDMQMPSVQPNPNFYGTLQLFISVPSQGVNNQYLGQKDLLGQQLGTYQSYEFAVSDFVRTKLAGKTYADLTFTIGLTAPAGVTGRYLFDNMRTSSPSTTPVGSVPGIDLVASVTKSPAANTPGSATFAAGGVQIPASFHVKLGSTGSGTAKLELGFGTTTNVTCTYGATSDAKNYAFSSCSTGNKAGDIVPAAFAKLTLAGTDPNQAQTKVRAQLSRNPMGDQLGAKLLPPIPTFWGDTLAEINTISKDWTNQVISTLPPPSTKVVNLPIPEFAKRKGDGTPLNVLDGSAPRPPNDPPFAFRGDLNNSPDGRPTGLFDAYYEVSGSITPELSGTHLLTHFNALTLVGLRVFEQNADALKATLTAETDNGGTNDFGSIKPKGKIVFDTKIFNITVIHEEAVNEGSFVWQKSVTQSLDLPPIQIWIFAIKAGATFSEGGAISGELLPNGFKLTPAIQASAGVHVWGGVNLGIASGGVDASIELLKVTFPLTFSSTFEPNNGPSVCAGQFNTTLDGAVKLASGGGSVDLTASLGPCPFCISAGLNIVHWDGLDLGTIKFPAPFPIKVIDQRFKLPTNLCVKPLIVTITPPAPDAKIFPDVPVGITARATRLNQDVPCKFLTWSSDDSSASFTGSADSCSRQVTFKSTGSKKLTVTARNADGETGTATISLVVSTKPSGAIPTITNPIEGQWLGNPTTTYRGLSSGGTGKVTAVWKMDDKVFKTLSPFTAGSKVTLPDTNATSGSNADHVITLMLTDGAGKTNSTSVRVHTEVLK